MENRPTYSKITKIHKLFLVKNKKWGQVKQDLVKIEIQLRGYI